MYETIYYYYIIQYQTEEFGIQDNNDFYAVDKSLFTHHNNEQIWVLDIVNTDTKDFRILTVKNHDSDTLQNFITKFVPTGNNIVTDG